MSRSASAIDSAAPRRKPPGEDAQACQHLLLIRVEQVEAPVERRAQRLLPLGPVACAAAEELEPLPEAREQRLRRQQLDPGRGELDRERQPVEPDAELRDRRRVLVRHGEARRDRARSLEEERHRLVPGERLERRQRGRIRQRERRNREGVLRGDAQRRAARHEHLYAGRGIEQVADRPRGVEQLLEVVEDEQHALARKVLVNDGVRAAGSRTRTDRASARSWGAATPDRAPPRATRAKRRSGRARPSPPPREARAGSCPCLRGPSA